MDDPEARMAQLEALIVGARHDVAGALTPALMVADRLRGHADPAVQLAAEKIGASILRATTILRATRTVVPPRK